MNRRTFTRASCWVGTSLRTPIVQVSEQGSNPWLPTELISSAELAKALEPRDKPFHVLCVGFPVLYRQRHIPEAALAGPGSKPEGIASLSSAVAQLAKSAAIVVYCGCCPMKQCPNVAPAYRKLKELGFKHVRVLDLPTNFHTDWTAKGYPTAK